MKSISKALLTGVTLAGFSLGQANAQSGAGDILKAGISDANILMNAYMKPFGEAFGVALNNNWYNTGKPLKLARFYVSFVPTLVNVPDDRLTYDVASLGLSNTMVQTNPEVTVGSTIFGSSTNAQPNFEMRADNPIPGQPPVKIADLAMPMGLGFSRMPLPMAQLSIGLIKGTEVTVRYLPQLDIPGGSVNGKVGLFGIGIKHDLKQWIPGMGLLPFDLSGYFNYSTFNFSLGLDLPVPTGSGPTGLGYKYDNFDPNSMTPQELQMRARGMGFGLIISKKLPFITPYASVGFANSNFSLKTAGDYAIETDVYSNQNNPADPDNGKVLVTKFTDPIDITADARNALRAGAGVRVKLLIMTIHGEYFIQGPFSGFNIGVGLGIGN